MFNFDVDTLCIHGHEPRIEVVYLQRRILIFATRDAHRFGNDAVRVDVSRSYPPAINLHYTATGMGDEAVRTPLGRAKSVSPAPHGCDICTMIATLTFASLEQKERV